MRSRILLALLALALVVLVVGPWFEEPDLPQTSYSKRPAGFRAFVELATSYREVEVWRGLPGQLAGSGRALLLLQPRDALLDQPRYRAALLDWVAAGNDLLIVPRDYETTLTGAAGQTVQSRRGGASRAWDALLEDAELSVPERTPALPVARRALADLPHGELLVDGRSYPARLPSGSFAELDSDWRTRAHHRDAPVQIEADHGAGRVVLIAAAQPFTNLYLGREGHAAAALALVHGYGADGLLVDEFFHGLPAYDSLSALFGSRRVLPLTVLLVLLVAAVVGAGVVRSRPVRPVREARRRSKREHLDALGRLIANGREGGWVARALLDGLHEDLCEALGASIDCDREHLAQLLARRDPAAAARYRALHEDARALPTSTGTPARRARLIAWGNEVLRLRRELRRPARRIA